MVGTVESIELYVSRYVRFLGFSRQKQGLSRAEKDCPALRMALPRSPCNLSPVKVVAIFQNLQRFKELERLRHRVTQASTSLVLGDLRGWLILMPRLATSSLTPGH